jgi:hypothetical protein
MGKRRTGHRRWPAGYPSGLHLGRSQGFTNPGAAERWRGGELRLIRSLEALRLSPRKT